MNFAYEARIPENLDSFLLGLAWFLFFLLTYFAVRWIASKFRRHGVTQAPTGSIPQVIHVYHHHVIEIRRNPEENTFRSKTGPEYDT